MGPLFYWHIDVPLEVCIPMDGVTLKQAFETLQQLLRGRQFELRGNCDATGRGDQSPPSYWLTLLVEGRQVCQVIQTDIDDAYALVVHRVRHLVNRGDL